MIDAKAVAAASTTFEKREGESVLEVESARDFDRSLLAFDEILSSFELSARTVLMNLGIRSRLLRKGGRGRSRYAHVKS